MSPEQIMLAGFVASAIVYGLKMLAQWFDVHPGRLELTIVLYVVSLGLGWLWTGVIVPAFPPFTDPVTFVAALLQYVSLWLVAVGPILATATLVYNLLYEKVIVPLSAKIELWHAKRELLTYR